MSLYVRQTNVDQLKLWDTCAKQDAESSLLDSAGEQSGDWISAALTLRRIKLWSHQRRFTLAAATRVRTSVTSIGDLTYLFLINAGAAERRAASGVSLDCVTDVTLMAAIAMPTTMTTEMLLGLGGTKLLFRPTDDLISLDQACGRSLMVVSPLPASPLPHPSLTTPVSLSAPTDLRCEMISVLVTFKDLLHLRSSCYHWSCGLALLILMMAWC